MNGPITPTREAERLLDHLNTLLSKASRGEEITIHHLVGIHGDVCELLHEFGGLDDLLIKYKL